MDVRRLQRGFQLVAADRAQRRRAAAALPPPRSSGESHAADPARQVAHTRRPRCGGRRAAPPRGASAPAGPAPPAPRAAVRHQPCQEDRFLREIAARHVGARGVRPTFGEGGVDGVQHGVEPPGKLLALRDANGMPACRILCLARTSRLPMAAGEVRNADAMVSAFRPRTTCSISGARTPASIAGCAQANIRARRRSGISASSAAASSPRREAATAAESRRGCAAAGGIDRSFGGRPSGATPPASPDSH